MQNALIRHTTRYGTGGRFTPYPGEHRLSSLPTKTKLIYALGGLGMSLPDLFVLQWLFTRYVPDKENALIPGAVFGVLFLLGRVGESIYNPIIGHWSDGFVSDKGRRIPFMRRSLVPLALAFVLLFNPPGDAAAWLNVLYALFFIQAYLFFFGMVITPYLALLPELTPNLEERVNITTLQAVFILLASICFSFMGLLIEKLGWNLTVTIVAVVLLGSLGPVSWTTREKPVSENGRADKAGIFTAIRLTLRNPAFICIAFSTSFYWFSLQLILLLVPFWVRKVLEMGESGNTLLMGPFVVFNFLAFFAVNFAAKRFGKYATFQAGLIGSAIAFALFSCIGLFPVGSLLLQSLCVVSLVGVAVAAFMVLPFALLADAVDYDEQITGRRREAMFVGVQGVFQKIFLGLAALTFGIVSTYRGNGDVSPAGLKLVAVAATISAVIAFLVFLRYPLRERDGKVTYIGKPRLD